jgi:hypothetical protein
MSVMIEGVQLDRGYISDEDTAIYNPGLTLLTESEKERLVEAITDARTSGQTLNTWNEDNQLAYEFLTEKLDPLHMRPERILGHSAHLCRSLVFGSLGSAAVSEGLVFGSLYWSCCFDFSSHCGPHCYWATVGKNGPARWMNTIKK